MPDNTILDPTAAPEVNPNTTVTPPAPPTEPPPASGTPFDYTKMVGAEGALADNWRDGLPEDIRNEKSLDAIKSIGALAQSYVHAQKSIGANKVVVPTENSTAEEWAAFYTACGRPDKAEAYTTDGIKLPDGVTLDETQMAAFRKFAFDHGLTQKAFAEAVAFDVSRVQAAAQAAQAAADAEYENTLTKLQQEYGSRADTVVAQCNQTIRTFGLGKVLREHGLLNNFEVISALAAIGKSIGETKIKGAPTDAPDDPQTRLDAIKNNPEDPFYKSEHPAHKARVDEVNGLVAAIARSRK